MKFKFEVELISVEREYIESAYKSKIGRVPPWTGYPKHEDLDITIKRVKSLNGGGPVWMNNSVRMNE